MIKFRNCNGKNQSISSENQKDRPWAKVCPDLDVLEPSKCLLWKLRFKMVNVRVEEEIQTHL